MFVIDHIGINAQPLVKAQGQEVTFFNEMSKALQPAKVCLPVPEDTPLPEPKSSHETQIVRSKSLGNVRVETSFINYEQNFRAMQMSSEMHFRIYRNEKLLYEEKTDQRLFNSNNVSQVFYKIPFSIVYSNKDNEPEVIMPTREDNHSGLSKDVFKYDEGCQAYTLVKSQPSYHDSISQKLDYDVVETKSYGNLTIKVIYQHPEGIYGTYVISKPRLQFIQWGEILLDEIFEKSGINGYIEGYSGVDVGIEFFDLEGSGDVNTVISFHRGGLACCDYWQTYYFNNEKQIFDKYSFKRSREETFDIRDLDGDGSAEIVRSGLVFKSYDGRERSILIQKLSNGKIIDVTRQFPKTIRENNGEALESIHFILGKVERIRRNPNPPQNLQERIELNFYYAGDFKELLQGLLAVYLANSYMLGEGEKAWEFVDRTYREADRLVFFYRLSMYLSAGGYAD
ncbi:hypothetical protein [Pseudanabaena sp. 'Roaring Creek']|uniref:hypothetical protein n=1 Tax=Pseudanabaena sp. 'Roaring Creek' TaxID=1681830 RepID=UPI001E3FF4EA|nr:hypothetical protein [Pseudanabaena sp. 'Roaring Creek']